MNLRFTDNRSCRVPLATLLLLALFSGPALPLPLSRCSAAVAAVRKKAEPACRRPETGENDDLVAATSELLRLLIDRGLIRPREQRVRRAVLQAVLDALDCGAQLQPGTQDAGGESRAQHPGVVRREVVGGVFAYLLLCGIDDEAEKACRAFVADAAEGHYEGGILDLRLASGPDLATARRCARAFLASDLPLVVLIGPGTRGSAEVLAASLKRRNVVLIGQPTAGRPFGQEARTLPGGDVVFVPMQNVNEARPRPVSPDITVAARANRAMLLDLDNDVDVDADAGLRRAVDLLQCIRVLGRPEEGGLSRAGTESGKAKAGRDARKGTP